MDDRTQDEAIVYECISHFTREVKFWRRLAIKGQVLDPQEAKAKETLNWQVFLLAAGTARAVNKPAVTTDLDWEFGELQQEIADHAVRMGQRTPTGNCGPR